MKLLILILSVLCTHQCLAAKQLSILDVIQSFVVDCFQQQKDTLDVAYTGDNIDQVLNAQAGRDFFLKSQNGLKINATVLAAALSECIKSKTQNEQIQNTVNENQLSRGLNFVLEDREISLQDIDDLIYSRGVYVRGRRSIVVPRNVVTDVIYTLLIEPFKTTVSGVIDQINGIILDYYVDTSNITDSFQLIVVNVVNSAVQSTVGVLTFVQTKVNSLFTTTNSTTSNDTEKMVRFTSLQTRETIVDTIISSVVTPLKTIVNNVLDSLITIVNSFIVADSDNIIQNVINALTNNVASAVVTSIENFQTVLNTFLDSLIATNSTTT